MYLLLIIILLITYFNNNNLSFTLFNKIDPVMSNRAIEYENNSIILY